MFETLHAWLDWANESGVMEDDSWGIEWNLGMKVETLARFDAFSTLKRLKLKLFEVTLKTSLINAVYKFLGIF